MRAVTATLAPAFSAELGLSSGDLGLLAGAYFFGFALTQLPLGRALDRHGPRRVILMLNCTTKAVENASAGAPAAGGAPGAAPGAGVWFIMSIVPLNFGAAAPFRLKFWTKLCNKFLNPFLDCYLRNLK